jgi:hypothetical protein
VGWNRERQELDAIAQGFSPKRRELSDWFYQPSWRRLLPGELVAPIEYPPGGSRWLLFLDDEGFGELLAAELQAAGQTVTVVRAGRAFAAGGPRDYAIDSCQRDDYVSLLKAIGTGRAPHFVMHLWGLSREVAGSCLDRLDEAQARGFYSLLFLAQALGRADFRQPLAVAVVTNHMQEVVGGDLLCPEKATVLGACRVVPQELPYVAAAASTWICPRPAPRGRPSPAWVPGCSRAAGSGRRVSWLPPLGAVLEPTPLARANGSGPLQNAARTWSPGASADWAGALRHLAETPGRLHSPAARQSSPASSGTYLQGHSADDAINRRILQIRDLESQRSPPPRRRRGPA